MKYPNHTPNFLFRFHNVPSTSSLLGLEFRGPIIRTGPPHKPLYLRHTQDLSPAYPRLLDPSEGPPPSELDPERPPPRSRGEPLGRGTSLVRRSRSTSFLSKYLEDGSRILYVRIDTGTLHRQWYEYKIYPLNFEFSDSLHRSHHRTSNCGPRRLVVWTRWVCHFWVRGFQSRPGWGVYWGRLKCRTRVRSKDGMNDTMESFTWG